MQQEWRFSAKYRTEICACLYQSQNLICIQYAEVAAYYDNYPYTINLRAEDIVAKLNISRAPRLPLAPPSLITLDMNAQTSIGYSQESLDVLPFITMYTTCRRLRFSFLSTNRTSVSMLDSFSAEILHSNERVWRTTIVASECVREVRLWWVERRVEIVLKPNSVWARDWDCDNGGNECAKVKEIKEKLRLSATTMGFWRGIVCVGSTEREEL